MDLAIDAADSGRVFKASVFGSFPLADVPCAPLGVLVVECVDGNAGAPLVGVLCHRAWDRRTDFIFEPEDMRRSTQKAAALSDYPIVIADHGDNCGAGVVRTTSACWMKC